MRDTFDREINYLRISVTDLCNLRCQYCMSENGVEKLSHDLILSPERIGEIVQAAAKLGINKVRLTGGEPLVRKGIIDIIKIIKNIPEIKDLSLTTNGVLLPQMAKELYDAGVDRLNISLDTLRKDRYQKMTRLGNIDDVLNGIKKAQEVGFKNTKINVVLIGGFNDDEVEDFIKFGMDNKLTIRFIELMPIGESLKFDQKAFLDSETIIEKYHLEFVKDDGVSKLYKLPNSDSSIGFIQPLSNRFCPYCNRLRLTADGKIKPCLHSSLEIDTNGYKGQNLVELLKKCVISKPKEHHLESGKSDSKRKMNAIGG